MFFFSLKLNFNPNYLINIRRKQMKKIISILIGAVVALNLSVSVVNAAAKEVRIAFFLEWASPNQEDKV